LLKLQLQMLRTVLETMYITFPCHRCSKIVNITKSNVDNSWQSICHHRYQTSGKFTTKKYIHKNVLSSFCIDYVCLNLTPGFMQLVCILQKDNTLEVLCRFRDYILS